MKRKITAVLTLLCMIIALLPSTITVYAATSGTCGSNLTWTLDNGTLTISGTGSMKNYKPATVTSSSTTYSPWYYSAGAIRSIKIGYGVTSIGNGAFPYCSITDIEIPETVTRIGSYAFYECIYLENVTLPKNLVNISGYAFNQCTSLKEIIIPDTVTTIDSSAFNKCENLANVKLSTNLTSLANATFGGCINITEIKIPAGVTSIGNSAFSGCEKLENVELPGELTSIGDYAFAGCSAFTYVEIPEKVKTIGDNAFAGCSLLKNIIIPKGVTSIGTEVFYNCNLLEEVTTPFLGTSRTDKSGVLGYFFGAFDSQNSDNTRTYQNKKYYKIPNSLKKVTVTDQSEFRYAFQNCKYIEEISLPANLESATSYSFRNCTGLKNVYYQGTAVQWYESGCKDYISENVLVSFPPDKAGKCGDDLTWELKDDGELVIEGSGAMTNYKCESLTPWFNVRSNIKKITLSEDVTSIGSHAFAGCTQLKEINMNEYISEIGDSAFAHCIRLSVASLPTWLVSIGKKAFYQCMSLKADIPPETCVIGESAFYRCFALDNIHLPENLITLEDGAFEECTGAITLTIENCSVAIPPRAFADCSALKEAKFRNGADEIGENAFANCASLETVNIPASVKKICKSAFTDCVLLKNVNFAPGVEIIDETAFYNCSGLEKITLPNTLRTIGDSVFENCSSLAEITLPNSLTTIGESAFENCSSLAEITLPNSVTSIGIKLFYNCSSLKSAVLSSGLSSTNNYTFYCCISLEKVTLPLSCTEIIPQAFDGCVSLSAIYYEGGVADWESINITDDGSENCMETIENAAKHFRMSARGSVIYGSCGTRATYLLYDDGELLIDGVGGTDDYENSDTNRAPWYSARAKIKKVTFGEGIDYIGEYVFYLCTSIKSVYLPVSLAEIGEYAFQGAPKITEVYYAGSTEQWKAITIGQKNDPITKAYITYNGTSTVQYTVTYKTYIGSDFTNNTETVNEGEYAVGVTAPERSGYTFVYWSREIGGEKFDISATPITGDTILYAVYEKTQSGGVGDDVTWTLTSDGELLIDGSGDMEDFFEAPWEDYIESIEKVTISDEVTSITAFAFNDCVNLKEVEIGKNVTYIGLMAFGGCTKLENIVIPEKTAKIEDSAFYRCYALKTVVLPKSLKTIGDYVFSSCYALSDMYYRGTESEWGDITIGDDDYLKYTKQHFETTESPITLSIAKTNTGNEFNVTCDNIPSGAEIVLALYEGGQMKAALTKTYRTEPLTFNSAESYDSIKVMAVNSLSTLAPHCDALGFKEKNVKLKTAMFVSEGERYFEVDTSTIPLNKTVVIALYKDGQLTETLKKVNEDNVIFFKTNADYDKAKIMAFDSFEKLTPYCAAYELN